MDLRGVKAVATFLADRLIVLRTSQERFLARYQRIEDATTQLLVNVSAALLWGVHTSEYYYADYNDDDSDNSSF